MKVIIESLNDKGLQENDWRNYIRIYIDDKKVFSVSDGEPEDSNLSRDFSDCFKIPDLLELAYEAGANGESFEIECKTIGE
jgi:hypothetical protein